MSRAPEHAPSELHPLDRLIAAMLRPLERVAAGWAGALLASLLVALVLAVPTMIVFAGVAWLVLVGATQRFDEAVLLSLERVRSPWLDDVVVDLTGLGDSFLAYVVAGVAALFLWLTGHRFSVVVLLVAVLGANPATDLLKAIFERPRPMIVDWIEPVHSPSFPSGHAMTAAVLYGSLAYLVARLENRRALRRATWVVCGTLVAAVAASRVYLGVHYLSDVLGGVVAGLAWLSVVVVAMHALRLVARRRPEIEAVEHDARAEDERERGMRG